MKIEFTQEELDLKINIIELEDLTMEGEYIKLLEESYIIGGKAVVDGETYTKFEVEFTLMEEPKGNTCSEILEVDWEFYDFLF